MTNATINQTETPAQAQRFDTVRKHYDSLGLCPSCAAQAAYGHQHGFSVAKSPCQECWQIIARFPRQEANGWRSLEWQKYRQSDEERALMHTLALPGAEAPLKPGCAA